MRNFILLSGLILLIFAGNNYLQAQTQKQALTFDDVRQWRTSSVTLSDDGEWYTTLYSLNDKPELITDSTNTKQAEQKAAKFYQDDNQTDVLYVITSYSIHYTKLYEQCKVLGKISVRGRPSGTSGTFVTYLPGGHAANGNAFFQK